MRGMLAEDLRYLTAAADVRLSPDGRHFAYCVTTVDAEANRYRTGIWLGKVDGLETPRALTSGAGADTLPRWSPDGRSLAYSRSLGPSSEAGVWVIAIDGPGEPTHLCESPEAVSELSWSPDGTRLAFVARDRDSTPYRSPGSRPLLSAAPARRLTRLRSRLNGAGWIYDCPQRLFVVSLDRSCAPIAVTDRLGSANSATWSPDGSRLAYVAACHEDRDLDWCNDIWVVEVTGGTALALTDTSAEWADLSWSPDGGQLAFIVHPTPLNIPRHGRVGVLSLATRERRDLSASLDRNASPDHKYWSPVWSGADLYFPVEDRGAIHVYRADAEGGTPELVIGGERVVHSFDIIESGSSKRLAAVTSAPCELPEVYTSSNGEALRRRTDLSRSLREHAHLVAPQRFTAVSRDGTEVECWAMVPDGVERTTRVRACG